MKDADKIRRLTVEERKIWVEVSRELRELERRASDLTQNLEAAAEVLARGKTNLIYNSGEGSEKLLAERQADFDACSSELNAMLSALEEAKTRLLTDPVRGKMAALEIAEMEKRMSYVSSQDGFQAARGAAALGELKYLLKETGVVDGGLGNGVFYAQNVPDVHISAKHLEAEIADRSGLRPSAARALMWALEDVVLYHLRANHSLSMGGMFIVSPTLRGTCTAAEMEKELSFKPYVTVKTQVDFQKRFRSQLAVRRIRATQAEPGLQNVVKLQMTGDSDVIRPGALVKFMGDRLDYTLERDDEGIFLCPQENRATEYRMAPLGNDKDYLKRREITVQLPTTLPWGTVYRVELRRRLRNSNKLRIYVAPFELDFPPA